ncbi:hypothetical protein KC887_04120 [Candidatus Kaiserbacteria bacterium]|nr:hypothetical protein [Candidatus Kaiserbacteria bacterium]
MAKYYGEVGYGLSVDKGNGIWEDRIITKTYYGEVIKDTRKLDTSSNLNGNVSIQNSITIVADDYAISNFSKIRFVSWSGVNWAVTSVEVQYPRLILRIGEVYNGPTT